MTKMVLEAADIYRLRTDICKLYQNKKVIVAPCRCKLYISRCALVIDNDGKISPDWFHFATGVTSLIYDAPLQSLMIALFDVTSGRMLWMLKVNSFTRVTAPNSSFHVLNTSDDCSEHVGLLYENREVATLLLKTFSLLANVGDPLNSNKVTRTESYLRSPNTYDQVHGKRHVRTNSAEQLRQLSVTNSFRQQQERKKPSAEVTSSSSRKGRLFRSFSFNSRNKSHASSVNQVNSWSLPRSQTYKVGEVLTTKPPTPVQPLDDRLSISSDKDMRKKGRKLNKFKKRSKTLTGLEGFPDQSYYQNNALENPKRNSVPELISSKVESAREDSLDKEKDLSSKNRLNCEITDTKAVSSSSEQRQSETCTKGESYLIPTVEKAGQKSEKKSSLFKRVKLKRSFSERLPRRSHFRLSGGKNVSNEENVDSDENTSDGTNHENKTDSGSSNSSDQYKKDRHLGAKPRAGSDSLLLKGDYVKCAVDTGHMARYLRERKLWIKTLESGDVMTTDLCVTEL